MIQLKKNDAGILKHAVGKRKICATLKGSVQTIYVHVGLVFRYSFQLAFKVIHMHPALSYILDNTIEGVHLERSRNKVLVCTL